MPYIDAESRKQIRDDRLANTSGELNYVFTKFAVEYFRRMGGRYAQINDVLGALEGAKLEFYRRIAVPYEDRKIIENGDVY